MILAANPDVEIAFGAECSGRPDPPCQIRALDRTVINAMFPKQFFQLGKGIFLLDVEHVHRRESTSAFRGRIFRESFAQQRGSSVFQTQFLKRLPRELRRITGKHPRGKRAKRRRLRNRCCKTGGPHQVVISR